MNRYQIEISTDLNSTPEDREFTPEEAEYAGVTPA